MSEPTGRTMQDNRESTKAFVEHWRRVGPILEEIRRLEECPCAAERKSGLKRLFDRVLKRRETKDQGNSHAVSE